ncbi:radical SAM protein [Myxococcota bacterium]|nr:radical SAM protein [Myxococcota bacterium]
MRLTDPRPHLRGLAPEAALAALAAVGAPGSHGRRILARAIRDDSDDLLTLPRVPKAVLARVADTFRLDRLERVESVRDEVDGSVKHLFRSPDGALHEAVWIPLLRPDAATVCLSSQVGCSLDCSFCATGRLGLRRNLHTWEMVDAFLQVRRLSSRRVTGAVFMGQGEPFLNYDQVIAAAEVLRHPCGGGVSGKAITLSTAGIVPAIRRFTAEGHPYRLIVSLTSTVRERRASLMPGASRWSPEELADALRAHARARGERVTVAWVCVAGVNMGEDEALGLRRLLGDVPLRLNLIEVNADPRRPSEAQLQAFVDLLSPLGSPVVRRYSVGREKHSACGMLAATRFSAAVPARDPGGEERAPAEPSASTTFRRFLPSFSVPRPTRSGT